MPFPGLWGSFDRILVVRKQRFSMSKFTICLQFSSTKWEVLTEFWWSENNVLVCQNLQFVYNLVVLNGKF